MNLTFADEGIDVETVGDGDSAIRKIAETGPDIILADVHMPGKNGYEICELVRSNEATRNTPVVLLVGSFEPFDEGEAARVGANAYLTKPFQSIRQLVAQVAELLEQSESPISRENLPDTREELPGTEANGSAEIDRFEKESYQQAPTGFEAAEKKEIEELYEQSLSSEDDTGGGLAELGVDDEMIETSFVGSENQGSAPTFEEPSEPPIETFRDQPTEEFTTPEYVDQFRTEAADEAASADSAYGIEPQKDVSKFENTISFDDWKPAEVPEPSNVPLAETSEPVSTEPQPEQFRSAAAGFPASDPRPIGEDTVEIVGGLNTTDSAAFRFDDIDLLDLAPASEPAIEITSPADAVEKGGEKQIVTLSPELIEMIAQRVVEKLSEKY